MTPQLTVLALVFGSVSMFSYGVARLLLGDAKEGKLRDRLAGRQSAARSTGGGLRDIVPLLSKMGEAAAAPFMPSNREKQSALRKSLARAGLYSPNAATFLVGAKLVLLCLGVTIGYVVGQFFENLMAGISFGGLLGYLAPTFWLKTKIKTNQRELSYGLADALDLMVVCVEAGLTIDAAMQRVGQELAIAHAPISRELGIAHMETRVGLSRQESLRNLGTRTGSQALQQVAAMLIQAERFGTSIANALRVQADTLRVKRQHAAEEMAAKASVKMSFPLVLFIFPATFIILAGPTVIGLMNSELMK